MRVLHRLLPLALLVALGCSGSHRPAYDDPSYDAGRSTQYAPGRTRCLAARGKGRRSHAGSRRFALSTTTSVPE